MRFSRSRSSSGESLHALEARYRAPLTSNTCTLLVRLRPSREILSAQESLKALSTKATSVQADCTKAEADNEMLQNYIDSITKSLAAKGSGGGGGG